MRTALITGASNGIGLEFARIFAREGWGLVLTARSEEKLDELAAELRGSNRSDVTVMAMDLAVDGAAAELVDRLQSAGIKIDALVNNAGIATHGFFSEIPVASEIEELHLNIVALTHLTKLLVPPMIGRKHGYVLNVASTAGFQPGPLMAVYYASKAYVLSLSEALANELRGSGVTVTALCPGATETGFQARAGLPRTRLYARRGMNAAQVARAGYDGMLGAKTIVIPGAYNTLMAFMIRFSPRALLSQIVRHLNESA